MKIKYDSSFWNQVGILNGIAQKTDWYFEHKGLKRCIPYIYRFRSGIVFDVLTFLDEGAAEAYFDKYKDVENELTESERSTAERESPYKQIDLAEIYINDIPSARGFSSSTLTVLPFSGEEAAAKPLQEAYRKQLKNTTCFLCQRFKVPYPHTVSVIEKLLRTLRLNKIRSLKIVTENTEEQYSIDASAALSKNEPSAEIRFINPVDSINYTLYLQKDEDIEIAQQREEGVLYFSSALYEIEPALPIEQQLQFDSSINHSIKPPDASNLSSASAIGIIGGADGPTVVFGAENTEVRTGVHGLPLHSCLSRITLCKQNEAWFCVREIIKTLQDSDTYIFE